MDEDEENQPKQSQEEGKSPDVKPDQGEQQQVPPPSSEETPKTQQPSLVDKGKQEKKKLLTPPRSFIIAIVTIIVTIIIGVAIALFLGKITQREPKKEEGPTPTLPFEPIESLSPLTPESSPSGKEATHSGSFEGLLIPKESEQATPSVPSVATQEATPIE